MSTAQQARREAAPTVSGSVCGTPESLGFFRGLVAGMRCGVVCIDAGCRLTLINDHARRVLGLAEPPAPGTPIALALPDHPRLVQALASSFQTVNLPNRAEMELDDGGKSIGFTVSLVHRGDGSPCGAAIFFKDLTPIEQREEQERLKDRLAALGQMAASMAHEIRNPLASIDVTCKLLERRFRGDDACRELLTKITAEVRRVNKSIDSCLRYVRPVSLSLAEAGLIPLLEEAIAVAEERRGSEGIEVRREYDEPIGPFLMDRELLRQVFVNLILNALEAAGSSGRVTVGARRDVAPDAASVPYVPTGAAGDPWADVRHMAVVRVADTGAGISAEDRARIFHPFFTTKKHGSGVGLAVAKKIVGSHHGMIDVTSAPGEGAEIVVRLPMVEADFRGPNS